MRGLDTPIRKIRREVFREIAAVAFESDQDHFKAEIEAIPYRIVQERAQYRDSIYRERAVASERVRLAMGMSLRPENKAVHITAGMEKSNIDEKYYEPPLMQVIPSACDACEPNSYVVSDMCRGCVAHPCRQVCPKGAIIIKKGKSIIDQEKCIRCGKCKQVCPYDAISRLERPCARACGVDAIESDEQGRAKINTEKCVSCGMCMVSCPFGAISDKSQIFQLCKALREGQYIVAEVAPAHVVFIGPCASKKLEASRRTVRSDVDFVITFEELLGMFDAKGIHPEEMEPAAEGLNDATAAGRGYAVAGGVADAIRQCVEEYYPDVPVKIEHAEGLADCKKALTLAKAGKMKGCLIEGMGCPGGCMAGAGTNAPIKTAAAQLKKFKEESQWKVPPEDLLELHLD